MTKYCQVRINNNKSICGEKSLGIKKYNGKDIRLCKKHMIQFDNTISEEDLNINKKNIKTDLDPSKKYIELDPIHGVAVGFNEISNLLDMDGINKISKLEKVYENIFNMALSDNEIISDQGIKIIKPLTAEQLKLRLERIDKAKMIVAEGMSTFESFLSDVTPFNVTGVSSKLINDPLFDDFIEEEFVGDDNDPTPILGLAYEEDDSKGSRLGKLYINTIVTSFIESQAKGLDIKKKNRYESKRIIQLENQLYEMRTKIESVSQMMMYESNFQPTPIKKTNIVNTNNTNVANTNVANTKNIPKKTPPPKANPIKKKIPAARARRLASSKKSILSKAKKPIKNNLPTAKGEKMNSMRKRLRSLSKKSN